MQNLMKHARQLWVTEVRPCLLEIIAVFAMIVIVVLTALGL